MVSRTTLVACVTIALMLMLDTKLVESRRHMQDCQDEEDYKMECPYILKSYGHRICSSRNRHLKKIMANCPKSCGVCKDGNGRLPSPTLPCQRTPFGCCWDGKTAAKDMYHDSCPVCQDEHDLLCNRFKWMCRHKTPNAELFHILCPVTCKHCTPSPQRFAGKVAAVEHHETLSDIIARVTWRKHQKHKALKRKHRLF